MVHFNNQGKMAVPVNGLSGASAGQTVFHAHIHLILRRDGDTANPKGGVRGVIDGQREYHPSKTQPDAPIRLTSEERYAMPKDAAKVRDQEVVLWDNTVTRLSHFWGSGPLVLVFLRHYG